MEKRFSPIVHRTIEFIMIIWEIAEVNGQFDYQINFDWNSCL